MISDEWEEPKNINLIKHKLLFDSGLSEGKLKFAIIKGMIQFYIRKYLGAIGYKLLGVPFENLTKDAEKNWIGAGFAETLTTKLCKVKEVNLLEREQLSKILDEIKFQMSGLVDENNIAPDTGFPHDLTDLFGLEVQEFDTLPPGEENHLTFKGAFPTSHLHPARLWCDIIEPKGCQILATYAKDFYAGRPAITMNTFGLGKAIYIGTMSHQHFYHDLVSWLRQMCGLQPLLKVPENIEVSMRQKEDMRVFFLLNHQNSPVRIQFYKPMHDFLTGNTFSGNYDLPPHGVLVLDEHPENKMSGGNA